MLTKAKTFPLPPNIPSHTNPFLFPPSPIPHSQKVSPNHYLYYKAEIYDFCMFSVCFLSGELAQIKTFIWFLLNEDWHFSLWNLNWNLNWKRRKIIFHFLIWPQINLSFCSDIRTSYLLKRKLGINTQHKRCYTFQRSLTKNKFTKVKVFPLSNIVI